MFQKIGKPGVQVFILAPEPRTALPTRGGWLAPVAASALGSLSLLFGLLRITLLKAAKLPRLLALCSHDLWGKWSCLNPNLCLLTHSGLRCRTIFSSSIFSLHQHIVAKAAQRTAHWLCFALQLKPSREGLEPAQAAIRVTLP